MTIYSPRPSTSATILAHLLSDVEGELNWGTRKPHLLNSQEYVNGYNQLCKFKEFGLRTPQFTLDRDVAQQWTIARDVVFGRDFNHTQGRDIVVYKPHDRVEVHDFYSKVELAEQEWRIHIFDGKSIARGLKVPSANPTRRQLQRWERNPWCRNRRTGWVLDHTVEPPQGLRKFAKAMVKAVGFDFGACDILQVGGEFVALEVNRAPGLDLYTAQQYVRAIREYEGL